MKFVYFILLFVIAAAISCNSAKIDEPSLIKLTKPINLEYELIKLDGFNNDEVYILTDLSNVVIINFWSSWCSPCVQEIEEFNKFQRKITNEKLDVKIIGINIFDNMEGASNFKIKYKPVFETLFDKNKTIPIDFGVAGVPETYFIKNNTILFKYVGKITEEILEKGFNDIKNE